MKGRRLLLATAVLALAARAWVYYHPSPESLIRRQLDAAARAASFGPNEGYLARLASAERLAQFFATNVQVILDIPGGPDHSLTGREEVQQAALAARSSARALTVSFPDATILVHAGNESALANVTLQAHVAGEPDRIVQEMKIAFRKIDGSWLITKVESVRTLNQAE